MMPLLANATSKLTQGDTLKKASLALGVVALGGVGIWAYNNYQKKQKTQAASNKYGDGSKEGLAVQYAGLMKSALYSGWFGWAEDEKSIYATAIKMHKNKVSFKQVANAYRQLYNDELLVRLNKNLKPEELEKFNNALNGKYKPVPKQSAWVTAAKVTNPWLNLFM